jgi:hypothetical protein
MGFVLATPQIAFAFQGRAVSDGEKLLGLLASQPVSQASSLLTDVGISVRLIYQTVRAK